MSSLTGDTVLLEIGKRQVNYADIFGARFFSQKDLNDYRHSNDDVNFQIRCQSSVQSSFPVIWDLLDI